MNEEVATATKNLDKQGLLDEIAQIESDIAELNRIQPVMEIDLPKTEDRLLSLQSNLEAIAKRKEKMASLSLPLANLEKGCEDIAYYASFTAQVLSYISEMDKKGQYDEAKEAVEMLRSRFLSLDYGIPLASQKAVEEIIGHEKAFLFAHKGEDNIAKGLTALSEEEFQSYEELIPTLGTSIRGEKSRHYHADKIIGFRYDAATKHYGDIVIQKQDFLDMIACDGQLSQNGIELSDLASARRDEFRRLMQNCYNVLSLAAFEGPDYEEALFYYEHRDFVDLESITEENYRLESETEFHFAYLLAQAEKKSDDEFYEYTKSLHDDLVKEDEFTLDLVAHMLASDQLSEGHFELLLSELKKTGFEVEVISFGKALELGLSEEKQFAMVNLLTHEKKKRGDIEKMGKYLYSIREHIIESQKKEFVNLLRDLIRSPHARRAITKSGSPAIHALAGEDYDHPNLPIGKREKNTNIRAWDFLTKGLYFGLAVFLPIGLCIAAYALMLAAPMPDLTKRLVLNVPIILAGLFTLMAIVRRYGFDERGAEGWGVGLGVAGILVSSVAMFYTIFPIPMKGLAPYGYSILGLGVVLGVCSLLLKQRRSAVRIVLTLPLVAVVITSAVFIVINSINGTL